MITRVGNVAAAFIVGAALLLTPVSAAQAQGNQQEADGLVNVQVGDVTILENVAVAAAVAAVVNLCPSVNASNIALLANEVDQRGGSSNAFCTGNAGAVSGPVRIVNN